MDNGFDWLKFWKWTALIAGGLLTLVGSVVLDGIMKEREYTKQLSESIKGRLGQD